MPFSEPEHIKELFNFQPGKSISSIQNEFHLNSVTRLDSNESPLGPSSYVTEAIGKALREVNRYPDPTGTQLKSLLGDRLQIQMNEIVLGNGSNELINLLIKAYCVDGDSIAVFRSAFIAYRMCALSQGVQVLETPILTNLRPDLSLMALQIENSPRVRIVFLANPNNPTGTYIPESELRVFLRKVESIREGSVMVVLDSAYQEYVSAPDLPDPLRLREEFPNIVILRTFSKAYGLAGLRIGYAIAQPMVVEMVSKVKEPYNANSIALAAAEAALKDKVSLSHLQNLNREALTLWNTELKKMHIPFWESQGNFILINTQEGLGMSGKNTFDACLSSGVVFRPVDNYGLPHALRISMGRRAENLAAIRVLQKLVLI